jgi:hypothetical protein
MAASYCRHGSFGTVYRGRWARLDDATRLCLLFSGSLITCAHTLELPHLVIGVWHGLDVAVKRVMFQTLGQGQRAEQRRAEVGWHSIRVEDVCAMLLSLTISGARAMNHATAYCVWSLVVDPLLAGCSRLNHPQPLTMLIQLSSVYGRSCVKQRSAYEWTIQTLLQQWVENLSWHLVLICLILHSISEGCCIYICTHPQYHCALCPVGGMGTPVRQTSFLSIVIAKM